MLSSFSLRRVFPVISVLALLLMPGCSTPPPSTNSSSSAAPASVTTTALQSLEYSGSQDALVALDAEIAAAGKDAIKLNAIATRLISMLRNTGTTAAARQAITERLSVFPGSILTAGDNVAVFTAMLSDQAQVNLARLALDQVPGPEVDALYVDALKASKSDTRLAIVQSIGHRRIAAAVPLLAPLLKVQDPAIVSSALAALGRIGTPKALSVVSAAPNPNSIPVVEAILAIANQMTGAQAARTFQGASENQNAPAHLRAAGFRGLLMADPTGAPARFVAALSGDDAVLKPVVIEAIRSHPSTDLVPALSGQLATWDAPTQTAVIAALGRRGEVTARSAVSVATRHEDPAVRAAAITALGQLPATSEIALLLGRIAAGKNTEDAKLARQSLSRLNGPGVADTVLSEATRGETPIRAVFIEQLALRNVASSVPLLLSLRDDPAPSVRSAALASLAEIAPPSEQKAILDWTIGATDAAEQARALRALASVTLRNQDVARRSAPITQALENSAPPVALRLLPVLPRIGGSSSAESASRLALRDDAAVSAAAINTLARWPNHEGLSPLVEVAANATNETARSAAMQGVVNFLERNRDLPSTDLTSVVARLVPLCRQPDTRSRLVYLLGRSSGSDALALAEKFKSDPEIGTVAADAAAIIAAKGKSQPSARASDNEDQISNIVDGKLGSRWSVPALPDQWIEVDYKLSRPFRQVVLDNNGAPWGSPEAYSVFVTDDPAKPGEPVVTGSGQTGKTTIDLPAGTRGRYLIVRHTIESENSVWSISELIVD